MNKNIKLFVAIVSLFVFAACSAAKIPSMEDEKESLRLIDEAVLYLREGELDRAESNFNLALELSISAAATDGLGCIAFARKDYPRAEELFWEAYDIDASYNNSLGNLALLYEVQGDMVKARELYEQALAQDTRNFRMRNNYAVHLAENDTSKEVVFKELYKAQALYNHPKIYDNINNLERI